MPWVSGLVRCGALAVALALVGCAEPVRERFTVQREGDLYFVREKQGWFSALFPCPPTFSRVHVGTRKVRMIHGACDADGQAYSLTFGRFLELAQGASSIDQIYEAAARELETWREGQRTSMSLVMLAGRPARYLSFAGIDGAAMNAHVWFLWAPEQQALYQVMVVGAAGRAQGERLARSLLVPSP